MEIQQANTSKKIHLELDENEYILIQYLLEKSMNKTKGKLKENLSEKLFKKMNDYEF